MTLKRIFWPDDLPHSASSAHAGKTGNGKSSDRTCGVAIGWANSPHDCLVVDVVPCEYSEVSVVQNSPLNSLPDGRPAASLLCLDDLPTAIPSPSPVNSPYPAFQALAVVFFGKSATVPPISEVSQTSTIPSTPHAPQHSRHSPSSLPHFCFSSGRLGPLSPHPTLQIIYYTPPRALYLQHYSVTPLALQLSPGLPRQQNPANPAARRVHLHATPTRPSPEELSFSWCIREVNLCDPARDFAARRLRCATLLARRPARGLRGAVSSLFRRIRPAASRASPYLCYAVLGTRRLAGFVLAALDWPALGPLKHVSATALQIDLRLQQLCYWPAGYLSTAGGVLGNRGMARSPSRLYPEYILLYNTLWLVFNDLVLGLALCRYISECMRYREAEIVGAIEWFIATVLFSGLRRLTLWLMDWPAGLKLNNELASFFGELFLWVLEFWEACVAVAVKPAIPALIKSVAVVAMCGGATLALSFISDIVSVLTLHIYSYYLAGARLYHWQIEVLASLFHMFRGKRKNVLRKRVDSCNYSLDQILLGTLFFTMLLFLLPTVMTFYFTFAATRCVVMLVNAVLETLLACLNYFPLFVVLLRVKDPLRVPGGVRFGLVDAENMEAEAEADTVVGTEAAEAVEVTKTKTERKSDVLAELQSTDSHTPSAPISASPVYLQLQNVPLPFSEIFKSYFELARRLQEHYLSLSTLGKLGTGILVRIPRRNLYRFLYSMLPEHPVSYEELKLRMAAYMRGEGEGEALGSE